MTEVLKDACKKFGTNSSNYGIKHKGRPLDLSRNFRQTGLPSGAKLELVVASKSPSVVSIALQLPDVYSSTVPGGRLIGKVPSDTTVWQILRKFESTEGQNYNFTARGFAKVADGNVLESQICYEMPTVNIMGRNISAFPDLQQTLAQLGFNEGSCLLRLNFVRSNTPLETVRAEIDGFFKSQKEEAVEATASAETVATEADTQTTESSGSAPAEKSGDAANAVANLLKDPTPAGDVEMPNRPQETQQPAATIAATTSASQTVTQSPKDDVLGPDQRHITIYSPPTSDMPKAALQASREEDFEPTIVHAKLHQDRLKNNSHNKRLLSDAETSRLEKEKEARLAQSSGVRVKIRFPDQSSIVTHFKAYETGAQLYQHVGGLINASNRSFKLVWNGGNGVQTVPNDESKKLIKDLKFDGAILVNFVWEDGVNDAAKKEPTLKPEYAQKAREVVVQEVRDVPDVGPSNSAASDLSEAGQKVSAKVKGGMPKWFKGLGKK
ncbi:putative tether UBX domain-containing protein for GLUT4 [Amylocarpus encephaloides]|uniref:Tether UBX domain-containing protein for GLUT4 n=1 Tax=Amylocarpus encephaloides TaxID=45428 RepID=A0A9P8C7M7_9HELO|nr:putative tether UBX domain-containing protein for GLUT4 [Amylocarpus encephaloides]